MSVYVPIKTIYYMLCYAWDRLENVDFVRVDSIPGNNIYNLFARILIDGINYIVRKGIDKSYVQKDEVASILRGKINMSETMRRILLDNGKVFCEYSELNSNVLHNQIIKSSIHKLLQEPLLDEELRDDLAQLYREFGDVELINISDACFYRVKLGRNNRFYGFIISVCKLLFRADLVSDLSAEGEFRAIMFSDDEMNVLFEEFVRNFYYLEQSLYAVKRRLIKWDAMPASPLCAGYMPNMKTDVMLESSDGAIIIETKFYSKCLQEYRGKKSLISQHLYQLFSYLKNLEQYGGVNQKCKGILLYPETDIPLNLSYEIQGHEITIKTIDLCKDWPDIKQDLIGLIA